MGVVLRFIGQARLQTQGATGRNWSIVLALFDKQMAALVIPRFHEKQLPGLNQLPLSSERTLADSSLRVWLTRTMESPNSLSSDSSAIFTVKLGKRVFKASLAKEVAKREWSQRVTDSIPWDSIPLKGSAMRSRATAPVNDTVGSKTPACLFGLSYGILPFPPDPLAEKPMILSQVFSGIPIHARILFYFQESFPKSGEPIPVYFFR